MIAIFNPNDIVGRVFKDYLVESYEGKQDKKHLYKIKFIKTGNEQLEERQKIRNWKCKDLKQIKLEKQVKKQKQLKERSRITKKTSRTLKKIESRGSVLIIDQASNTGYAVYNKDGLVFANEIQKKEDNFWDNMKYILDTLQSIAEYWKVDAVIFEGVYLGMNANVLEKLAGLKGGLIYFIQNQGLNWECVPVNAWKGYHGIRGKRVDQKKKSVQLVQKLTGKRVNDNIADAILIGEFAVDNIINFK